MSTFIIPCSNVPQSFQISLAGKNYQLTVKWNAADDAGWIVDFTDGDTGVVIVAGIPFVTGVNMLDGLGYLGINGTLFCTTDGDQFAPPTLDNLGVNSNLFFDTQVANA